MTTMWRPGGQEESIGEIVTRVVDNGKEYVRAEIALVKAEVRAKTNAVWPAAALIVAAIFLLQAALTVLAAALGLALARWLGVPGGLAVGAVIVLAIASALVLAAVSRLKKAFA